MKKLFIYIATLLPIVLLWLHWGGIKSDSSTFTLMLVAVFACTVVTDKIHEKSAKADKNNK